MAVLSDPNRLLATEEYARENADPIGVTRPELRAAVDATDAWIDANAASYNLALPTAARNNLTAKQKARLFFVVARRRFEIL